jgi:hypothetical protein
MQAHRDRQLINLGQADIDQAVSQDLEVLG